MAAARGRARALAECVFERSSSGSDMRRHGCMFLTFTRFVGLTGALSPHIMLMVAAAHFAGCDDDDFRFIGVELVGVCECVWFFFVYSMCVRKCIRRVSAVMWCMPKTNPDGNQQQKRRVCVCVFVPAPTRKSQSFERYERGALLFVHRRGRL